MWSKEGATLLLGSGLRGHRGRLPKKVRRLSRKLWPSQPLYWELSNRWRLLLQCCCILHNTLRLLEWGCWGEAWSNLELPLANMSEAEEVSPKASGPSSAASSVASAPPAVSPRAVASPLPGLKTPTPPPPPSSGPVTPRKVPLPEVGNTPQWGRIFISETTVGVGMYNFFSNVLEV